MQRFLTVAVLLALGLACGPEEPSTPATPPVPQTTPELLVGTWALDPADAERVAGWKATIEGGTPRAADEAERWLATHRDAPSAKRVLDAVAAADAVRMDVTADTLTVRRADRTDTVHWTSTKDQVDDRGHRTLLLTTTTDAGITREVEARLPDDDHLVLTPTTGEEPAWFRRVSH